MYLEQVPPSLPLSVLVPVNRAELNPAHSLHIVQFTCDFILFFNMFNPLMDQFLHFVQFLFVIYCFVTVVAAFFLLLFLTYLMQQSYVT